MSKHKWLLIEMVIQNDILYKVLTIKESGEYALSKPFESVSVKSNILIGVTQIGEIYKYNLHHEFKESDKKDDSYYNAIGFLNNSFKSKNDYKIIYSCNYPCILNS